MTQTNNEREKLDVRYFNEKLRLVLEGLQNYTRSELSRELQRLSNTASPISQNEHQEAVANLWEALGKWSAYLASNGEQANLAPPSWLIDAVSSATSPPKQIPDGWKLVPIEPTDEMKELGWNAYRDSNKPAPYNALTDAYKAMLNAAPTNTEVGNDR